MKKFSLNEYCNIVETYFESLGHTDTIVQKGRYRGRDIYTVKNGKIICYYFPNPLNRYTSEEDILNEIKQFEHG